MHGDAREHRRIVAEQIAYRRKALWDRGANVGRRLEDAGRVARRREQIGDAVPHEAAADDADFLLNHA